MMKSIETKLIERCLKHLKNKTTDQLDQEARQPTEHYFSENHLELEIKKVLKKVPVVVGASAQLKEPGDSISFQELDLPVLIVRNNEMKLNAFVNVCRHRGTLLMKEKSAKKKKCFTCPYHSWTYDLDGKLIHVPHKSGFSNHLKSIQGLIPIPVEERHGLIWILLQPKGKINVSKYLGKLDQELADLKLSKHFLFRPTFWEKNINWKIAIDSFLETYHVQFVHQKTIAPMFTDNLLLFDSFKPHSRNVFVKKSVKSLENTDPKTWNTREHINLLYFIFPNTLLLIEPDHINSFTIFPKGSQQSNIYMHNFTPNPPEEKENYWNKNVDLLHLALNEDLDMGERIQMGLSSGEKHFHFGKFEAPLQLFHKELKKMLSR